MVGGVLQAARMQSGSSAASRSQLLLQQLQQKYAKPPQPSRRDKGPTLAMRAFDCKSKDIKQPSQSADICAQPFHIDRPELSRPVFGKLSAAVPEVKQTAAGGAMPMRTRAQGGRKRRK